MDYILINDSLERNKSTANIKGKPNSNIKGKEKRPLNELLNDENFIGLINALSRMIKNFIINEKSLIKEFQSIHSTINREANSLHAIFKDNNGIVSYDSKEVNAMIKNISTSELRSFELLASFDKNDSAFFQEVKEIFKKLQMIQIKAKTHSIVAPIQKKPIFKIKPTLNQSLKKRFLSHSRNISLNKSIDNSRTFQKTHTKNTPSTNNKQFNILKTLGNLNNSFDSKNYMLTNSSQVNTEGNTSLAHNLNNTLGLSCTFGDLNELIDTKYLNTDIRESSDNKKSKVNVTLKPKTINFNETNLNVNTQHGCLCDKLAKSTIEFISNMKSLQEAITKKKSDVTLMKKKFEKQKKDLYNLAVTIDKSSNDSIDKKISLVHPIGNNKMKKSGSSSVLTGIKIKELETINKTLKDKIEELKEEINQKDINNQTIVVKEQEINSYKEQIEEMKKENKTLSHKNISLTTDISTYKLQIETYAKDINSLKGIIANIHTEFIKKLKEINIAFTIKTDSKYKNKTKLMHQDILSFIQLIPKESSVKTVPTSENSTKLIEENKRLRSLFEDCMNTISNCIKEYTPHILLDTTSEDDDMSFNIASGANNSVNLVDSTNTSKIESSHNTIDRDSIKNAVDLFKKFIQSITQEIKALKIENEELKISLNTYKEDLDKAMNGNNNNKSEKEFAINFNNLTKTFTFKDIDSNQIEIKDNNPLNSPSQFNDAHPKITEY